MKNLSKIVWWRNKEPEVREYYGTCAHRGKSRCTACSELLKKPVKELVWERYFGRTSLEHLWKLKARNEKWARIHYKEIINL